MTKEIFVVMGECGEYDDHSEWMVVAYTNAEKAAEHAEKAELRAKELYAQYEFRWNIPEHANEFDPDMQTDYTGTTYSVATLNLVEDE